MYVSKFISLNTLNSKKFYQLFDVVFESSQGKNTDAKQQSPRQQIILFSNTQLYQIGFLANQVCPKKHQSTDFANGNDVRRLLVYPTKLIPAKYFNQSQNAND